MIFAPDKYWNEIESIGDRKDATADHRIELWKIATRMYLDNPVLGVGPGNFRWRIGDYQTQEQIDHFGRSLAGSAIVHSTYFEVLSETGTVGLVSFLSMIGLTFRDLRRASKRCDRALASRRLPLPASVKRNLEWARAYALAFQGGLLGFLTSSAFVSTTYFSTIWMMCASSVAIRYIVAGELESAAETVPSSPLEPAVSPPRTPSAGSASDGRPRSPSGSGRLSDLLGDHGRR